jgi:prolyl oligopeptidase
MAPMKQTRNRRRALGRPAWLPAGPLSLSLPLCLAVACATTEAPPAAPPPSPAPPDPAATATAPAPAAGPAGLYPATRRAAVKDTVHGVEIDDPYRWLEDEKAPEVRQWMKIQDDFTRARLAALPGREAIAARLKELFYIDALGIPIHRGSRYFYTRRHATKEKTVVYWKEGKNGAEKVLFDPNTWAADGSLSLGAYNVSWDGKRVAYRVKKNNSDESTLYVMDVATGKKSEVDVIEGTKYGGSSWTPKGDGFYYTWIPSDPKIPVADRPGFQEVRFHKLGTDASKDVVVREKTGDPRTFAGASLSRDGRWLFYYIARGTRSTDVWFRDQRNPAKPGPWQELAVGRDAVYSAEAWKNVFYVHTNDGAPKYRVFRVDPARPQRDAWQEIVGERTDATLEDVNLVGGHLSLGYLKDVASLIEVRTLQGKLVREVTLPTVGSSSTLIGNEDEDEAYYSFTSFTRPSEIYQTSVKTGKTSLFFKVKIPVDTERYVVEQAMAPSRDGTKVPIFIVRAKDLKKDGTAPTLLYGYGGFRVSITPGFRSSIFPWLERGGVFVAAALRGGNEYGEEWHKAGMRRNKQNVFDDFIAAAEYLVKERYTRPDKLVIQGGSNGGLLVGAALTQRPDLFGAVLCAVPLIDMVRFHLSGSGKTWIEEYGSAEDAEDFKVLHEYSPYHRVRPGTRYPAVLVLSADSDDRVDPMHARKFAARLQEASRGGPVWLRIERNSGHGGADMVKAAVEQTADSLAFALQHTGGAPPPATN